MIFFIKRYTRNIVKTIRSVICFGGIIQSNPVFTLLEQKRL